MSKMLHSCLTVDVSCWTVYYWWLDWTILYLIIISVAWTSHHMAADCWKEYPRVSVPREPGGSCKISYDLISETQHGTSICILLSQAVHQGQHSSRRGSNICVQRQKGTDSVMFGDYPGIKQIILSLESHLPLWTPSFWVNCCCWTVGTASLLGNILVRWGAGRRRGRSQESVIMVTELENTREIIQDIKWRY